MKSRVTTYLLVCAVLGVWGVVVWKLFFSGPELPATVAAKPPSQARPEPEEDFLLLNYSDPFMRNTGSDSPAVPVEAVVRTVAPPVAPPPKISKPQSRPPVKYAGTIGKGDRISHVFEHAGLLHPLSPGDELEGYTLIEVFDDSVRMTKDGERFTIRIER